MDSVRGMVKKNYEISKGLNNENDKIYTDIVCYLRVALPESVKTEEIISDILEMLLRGQQQGKSTEDIIGEDYKSFCDSIIETMEIKRFSTYWIKENLQTVINCFFILLTINIFIDYLPKAVISKSITSYTFTLGFVINSIVITALAINIVNYVGKNSFKLSGKLGKKQYFILWLVLTFIISLIFISSIMLSKYKLFSINIFLMVGIVGSYWIYRKVIKN